MYKNEAEFFYDWTLKSHISYADFLQAKRFERSIRFAINEQTSKLVATSTELADRGLNTVSQTLDEGFLLLSQEISDVRSAIHQGTAEIVSTLNWGFSEVLISLGRMNDSLGELIRLVRSPSQTWAYEQFDVARDEFRRRLYPEALESVDRAINGFQSNVGYKSEFRFHFLRGTILLGSYDNHSGLLNAVEAEKSFLLAARYAEADFPQDAAAAFICAGRSAYIQGKLDRTLLHTGAGLAISPDHAEGNYQFARASCELAQLDQARHYLCRAIALEINYAIFACGELAFLTQRVMLESALAECRSRYVSQAKQSIAESTRVLRDVSEFSVEGISASEVLQSKIKAASRSVSVAESKVGTETIFGAYKAMKQIDETTGLIDTFFPEYQAEFGRRMSQRLSDKAPSSSPEQILVPMPAIGAGCIVFAYQFIRALFAPLPFPMSTDFIPGMAMILAPTIGYGLLSAALIFAAQFAIYLVFKSSAERDSNWRRSMQLSISDVTRMSRPKTWTLKIDPL